MKIENTDIGIGAACVLMAFGAGAWICAAETRPDEASGATVVVVVGAAGTPEYGKEFLAWAGRWKEAASRGKVAAIMIGAEAEGSDSESTDRGRLRDVLRQLPKDGAELWLVLIGHGTFDTRSVKFNLRGPDVSDSELAEWLSEFKRPTAVIACYSSSAPLVSKLARPGRVVITATKSGYEQNHSRFGEYLSLAIGDPQCDLDKDNQTSLLEAFLNASRRTSEFYELQGRLATEHSLLDDNGDGRGTRADWFRGLRPAKQPEAGATLDGLRAHQWHLVRSDAENALSPEARQQRDGLELAVAQLRASKNELDEETYFRRLEDLLLQLARFHAGESRASERGRTP